VASRLELRGVGKLLGTAWAVRGVTVDTAAGELVIILIAAADIAVLPG
jgi:hypothetical protein